ncbi:MAG TPA: type II restriction endonuclease [Niastella sp.]
MNDVLGKAIDSARRSKVAYCKYLAANDTKATKSHQSGYLISKSAWKLFLTKEPMQRKNLKVKVTIKWQHDVETKSVFTYYGAAKNEFRLTRFGRKFPFREKNNVGDLLVLCKKDNSHFEAYILSHDYEIDEFFAALNISSTETNGIIPKKNEVKVDKKLLEKFNSYLNSLSKDFPTTSELASNARECYNDTFKVTSKNIEADPDKEILEWLKAEYELFKVIENDRYKKGFTSRFTTVEEFLEAANKFLQRRKSRAGWSLEHHLVEIFRIFDLQFDFGRRVKTEGNKKPDFLFPGKIAYQSKKFNANKLVMLAAKTTCKDRWRQILNEADKIKTKHLFTLQQGISENQLKEMYECKVQLVVPKAYLHHFPKSYQNRIWTLAQFIKYVQRIQSKM